MNNLEAAAILRAVADKLAPATDPSAPITYHPGTSIPVVTGNYSIDMTVAMLGGVPAATPERDAALAAEEARQAALFYHGAYAAAGLTLADKAYLVRVQDTYFQRTHHDIWRDGIVSGTDAELRRAATEGEAWRNNYSDEEAQAWLRAAVEARLR